MSRPERIEKIKALLNSPVEGERAAAKAALDRSESSLVQPAYGTAEWHTAIQEWAAKLSYCFSRLGSPILSPSEVTLVRNWHKFRGDPWGRGASDILGIYRRLKQLEAT